MQRKNTMNHLDKTNEKIPNSCNNKVVTLQNKCYNDMSKSLTEKKLREVLNSLEECPSKEYLMNIWSHTVGVAKEGLDNILKELKELIQKYLDNDIYVDTNKYGANTFLYDYTWKGILFNLCGTVASEENSFESVSLEIFKNCNIYKRNLVQVEKNKKSKRKKYLKHKKEDINKTKDNVNDLKCNELCLEENKHSINNDLGKSNKENESNISTCYINYNDISKNLTETELREVLNSFKECPPKEDLRNIWNHTLGVAKEGFYDIQKDLKGSIQKYLDNDIDEGFDRCSGNIRFLFERIWNENISTFYKAIATEELEYNKNFFILINGKHTLDDILNFIYSFLDHIKILKNELYEKHQKELSQKISQISNKKK